MKSSIYTFIIIAFLIGSFISCSQSIDYTNSDSSSSNGNTNDGRTGAGNINQPAPIPSHPGTNLGGTDTINVSNVAIAYTTSNNCATNNEVFTFTGKGIPTGATYQWWFGDLVTTTGNPVMHSYTYTGSYNVLAKVMYNNKILDTVVRTIIVSASNAAPVASFNYQQPYSSSPNYISFVSSSTISKGSISSYVWNYGDGTISTGQTTTHTYPQVSSNMQYNASLTVTSDSGCTNTITKVITIPAMYSISGGFTAVGSDPCAPYSEIYTFTSALTGVPAGATYTWSFGDGTFGTGLSATKTYSTANTYSVSLTISLNGVQIYSVAQPVSPFGQDVTPTAAFTTQVGNAAGTMYNFNNQSILDHGTIVTYAWSFGDSGSGSTPFISHIYTQVIGAKTYTVTLIVIANSGCSSSTSTTVIIPSL